MPDPMPAGEVPDELVADAVDAWHEAPRNEHGHIALDDLMRFILAAVLPADRAAERAKAAKTTPPQPAYTAAWTELRGYVRQARADGDQIDPSALLAYMTELRRNALAPVRAWVDGMRGGGQQASRPRRVRNTSAGVAYCAACHRGDCRNPPAPHTWVDERDDPALPDPVPPKLAAQLAADHPCACECAGGEA